MPKIAQKCSGKYAKYSKKYNKDWENEKEFKGWLQESKNNLGAYCKFCKAELRAQKNDLMKHAKTKMHTNNRKQHEYVPSREQLNLTSLGISTITTVTEQNKIAELQLAVYIAMHSAVRSVDHLGVIINQNRSNSKDLRLHRTKCSVLIKNVCSPAILEELVEDLGDSKYSLILDESTDISVHKYMAVCIRYYSIKKNKMCTEYLGMFEVGRARAEDLYEGLLSFLANIKLNVANIMGLGTDGANNLCGRNNSLYTRLKDNNPNLILTKCICHSIHLSASKATEEMPASLDFLIRETYNWFSNSPLRKMNYENIYSLINDGKKPLNLVQLSKTRWLSRYNCVERILAQWVELKSHFEIANTSEKCYTSRVLLDMYKDENNQLYLIFLKPILKELSQCNLLFQSENVDVEIIYDNLKTLLTSFCKRLLKQSFINKLNNTNWQVDTIILILNNELAHEPTNDIDYGTSFLTKLADSRITAEEKCKLKLRCSNFIKKLCFELVSRLPENMTIIEKLKMFSPKMCLNQIRPKFSELPLNSFNFDEDTLNNLESQWRNLLCVNWADFCDNDIDTCKFWTVVLNYENAIKEKPFFLIAKNIMGLLSTPVSNAVVERVFSVMNSVKTKPRNRMHLDLLDAILRVRLYFASKNCCQGFMPTKKMLNLFSSQMYKNNFNDNCSPNEADNINEVWEINMS